MKKLRQQSHQAGPWRLRLVVLGAAFLSLAMVWISVVRLGAVQREIREYSSQNAQLAGDIEALERLGPAGQLDDWRRRQTQAVERLRPGTEIVRNWIEDARAQAAPLGLDVNPRPAAPATEKIGGIDVTLVPATLDIRPIPGLQADRTACQRVLDFCLYLTAQTNRADLLELTMAGASNTVSSATASFALWAREAKP